MREILFRGKKSDDNTWVEGLLVKDTMYYGEIDEHIYIVNHEHPSTCFGCDIYHEVAPDTVDQYTGVYDKNGKKIFENDIIKEEDVLYNGVVQIRGKTLMIVWSGGCWCACSPSKEVGVIRLLAGIKNCEVIGNLHEGVQTMEEKT